MKLESIICFVATCCWTIGMIVSLVAGESADVAIICINIFVVGGLILGGGK